MFGAMNRTHPGAYAMFSLGDFYGATNSGAGAYDPYAQRVIQP